jgi:hypothetical protein
MLFLWKSKITSLLSQVTAVTKILAKIGRVVIIYPEDSVTLAKFFGKNIWGSALR